MKSYDDCLEIEAEHTELMEVFPKYLGEIAEQSIIVSKEVLFSGKNDAASYTGRLHDSGDDQVHLDRLANVYLRKRIMEFKDTVLSRISTANIIFLSEEECGRAFTGTVDDPIHCLDNVIVVVADPIDGTTNLKSYSEGAAATLVAFFKYGKRFVHIGGAIASTSGTTVIWSGMDWVLWRYAASGSLKWTQIKRARGNTLVAAAVATKPVYHKSFRALSCENVKLAHSMAGTPSIFPLLKLDLGMIYEPRKQKVWDAAHLIPALLAQCTVTEIATGQEMCLDSILGYWDIYLNDFVSLHSTPLIPPFIVKVPIDPQMLKSAQLRLLT
jgi:fructose-1,6-bisphosphatase/inositol monophosphatase family enzyme